MTDQQSDARFDWAFFRHYVKRNLISFVPGLCVLLVFLSFLHLPPMLMNCPPTKSGDPRSGSPWLCMTHSQAGLVKEELQRGWSLIQRYSPSGASIRDPHAELTNAQVEQRKRFLSISSVEAANRTVWIGAVTVQFIVLVIAVIGCVSIALSAARDHTHRSGSHAEMPWKVNVWQFVVLFIGAVTTSGALFLGLLYVGTMVTACTSVLDFSCYWTLGDPVTTFVKTVLLDGQGAWVSLTGFSVMLAVVVLLWTAWLVLLRHPKEGSGYDGTWMHGVDGEYGEFLRRSFERLRYLSILGAILLVVFVAQASARYYWPLSLLASLGVEEVVNVGRQTSIQLGVMWSAMLIAIFVPGLMILRERARQWSRFRQPDYSTAELRKWSEDNGLAPSVPQALTQYLTLFGPAAAGAFLPLFEGLMSP